MRIVLAGATGFIGTALSERLRDRGHELIRLSRRPGAGDALWDARSLGEWQAELEGADAVVNLAGAGVADGRWTAARKRELRESRVLSTRALVAAIASAKRRPGTLLNASAVGYYGDRGEEELDERSAPGGDFLASLCADWEQEALRARESGLRVVCLRTGIVLSPRGGALGKMLLPFRLGLGGPLGSGRQWMPWITLEDEIGLIEHLLESDASGPVNLTAPQPARNADFAKALGRALGRPAVLPAPAFALRLALGEMAGMLLGGQRALPRRALESGYRFRSPELEPALRDVLK